MGSAENESSVIGAYDFSESLVTRTGADTVDHCMTAMIAQVPEAHRRGLARRVVSQNGSQPSGSSPIEPAPAGIFGQACFCEARMSQERNSKNMHKCLSIPGSSTRYREHNAKESKVL